MVNGGGLGLLTREFSLMLMCFLSQIYQDGLDGLLIWDIFGYLGSHPCLEASWHVSCRTCDRGLSNNTNSTDVREAIGACEVLNHVVQMCLGCWNALVLQALWTWRIFNIILTVSSGWEWIVEIFGRMTAPLEMACKTWGNNGVQPLSLGCKLLVIPIQWSFKDLAQLKKHDEQQLQDWFWNGKTNDQWMAHFPRLFCLL